MDTSRTTSNLTEAFCITTICFGWPIIVSIQSVFSNFSSGSFSDSGFYGLIAMEVVLACTALVILHARKYAIGALYPAPSWKGIAIGTLLYVIATIAGWVVTMPFATAQHVQPIDTLMSDATVSLATIVPMALVNGAYEEVFLLGFLARGLRGQGTSIAFGLTLLVRVLYHLYQGPLGAVSVLGFGAVLTFYYLWRGALFPVVFAHVLADIVPFV